MEVILKLTSLKRIVRFIHAMLIAATVRKYFLNRKPEGKVLFGSKGLELFGSFGKYN